MNPTNTDFGRLDAIAPNAQIVKGIHVPSGANTAVGAMVAAPNIIHILKIDLFFKIAGIFIFFILGFLTWKFWLILKLL